MSIRIRTPEGAIVNFPDDMSHDDIVAAMQKISPGDASSTPKAASGSIRDQYKEAIRRGDETYPGTNIPVPGTLGLLQRRMSDPLGIQDELVGGGAALGKFVSTLGDTTAAGKAYTEAAERVRAEKEMARERLGWGGALAADVLGGFGTSGPAKAYQATNFLGSQISPWLNSGSRIAQSAKGGALYGGVAGAGNAEGDIGDRVVGGLEGVGTGAVLGPVLSEVVAPAASSFVRGGYNALSNPAAIPGNVGNALSGAAQSGVNALQRVVPGVSANIDDTLLRALQRQGMTPAEAAAQYAQDRAAMVVNGLPVDVPVTLADSGPGMRELAYTVKAQPGAAKAEAERVLEGRQRGQNGFNSQYDRMKEGTQSALQAYGENAAKLEDTLNASRSKSSNEAYEKFRGSDAQIPVEDILQQHAADTAAGLTTNSALAKDIDKAYAPFIQERYKSGGIEGPSRIEEAQHNLKIMALDKQIAEAEAKGAGSVLGEETGAQAATPVSAPDRAQSIIGFLRSRGGVKPSGEHSEDVRNIPGLVSSRGLTPEKAREELLRAGFMRENPGEQATTSVADFHDLLNDVAAGKKVSAEGEAGLAQAGKDYAASRNQADAAEQAARDHLKEIGLDPAIYDKMTKAERAEVARRVAQNPEMRRLEENAKMHFENGEFDKLAPDEKVELSKRVDTGEDPHDVFEELAIRAENNKSIAAARQQADERFPGDAAAADSEYIRNLKQLREGLISEFAAKSKAAEPLSPTQFDNAKKQLDDQIETAVRAGDRYKASLLTDLKKRLVQRADEATTVRDPFGEPIPNEQGKPVSLYQEARSAFQKPTQTLDALEGGRKFLQSDLDRVKTDVNALSPEQKQAYRVGAANSLVEKFGNKNTGNNIPLQLDTPNIQTRLGAVAGQESLDQLNALRGLETRMFQTRNRVMGGSKTAENQQNLGEATLDAASTAIQKLTQGKPIAAAAQAITKTFQYVYRFREEDAATLARILFETDPARRAADLAGLQRAYGAPRVQQAVNAITQAATRNAAMSTVAPVVGNFLAPSPRQYSPNALSRSARY